MWQVEVPMIMTIRPGSVTVAAGTGDVGIDVGDRDRRPWRQSGPGGGLGGQSAGPLAGGVEHRAHLVVDDGGEGRIEGGEVARVREAVALRPHRLVAGGAGVARLDAGQLPDDPVGRLDQAVGRRIDLGRLVEDLERLREEPLGRDLAAVAVEPGLAGRARDVVDPVGLGLGGVMLPELDPGVRVRRERRADGTAACRRPCAGSIVQAVKSIPMPMTSVGSTPLVRRTAAGPRLEDTRR